MSENQPGEAETTESPTEEKQVGLACGMLAEIVALMGFRLEVEGAVEDGRIMLRLDGEEAAELIGRKGQTLDALQFLLNRMLNRQLRDRMPVVVDTGGYRQRRADALKELAERLGEKATRTGKIVAVNPMSAHDRRIIHMALREVPGITTRSEGEGASRRLLIVPEPE
jgi:spoIIIJ-associated protein